MVATDMRNWKRLVALTVVLAMGGICWAADEKQEVEAKLPVAATVNGKPIYVGEIDDGMDMLGKSREVNPQSVDQLKADLLRRIVKRRLVSAALKRDGEYDFESKINDQLTLARSRATTAKTTLEKLAAKRGRSVDSLREDMFFNLAWEKYLERNLASALEGFFEDHHKELDGTEVRASHILLRPNRPGELSAALTERAKAIREEIDSGKLTFEKAAEKYSAGPSRHQGGDVGYFPRFGVMSDEFAKVAFALDKDKLSKPVVSPFGVHLIRVTDIRPGNKRWAELAEQMKGPAATDLFDKMAAKEMQGAKVEYTGVTPYFKPGTDDLVMPKKAVAK